jgi:intracellular sulfur oxidation DsrE/DsrF family protein
LAELQQFDPATSAANKVLLHISTMDTQRIEAALNTAERIVQAKRDQKEPVQIEIVANAEGLGLLRRGSPYAERIRSMVEDNPSVSFLACGIAMENAELKEGGEIELIPEAREVDAALEEILRRLKLGWLYIKA